MCQLLSYRRFLPASLLVSFAALACGGSETAKPVSDHAQGGSVGTTSAQGGGTATTAQAGGATVGGSSSIGTGGGAFGTASAGTATAGGSSAGGSTPASIGGAVSTGGTNSPTTPAQCDSTQARRDANVRLVFPTGMTAPTPSSLAYGDAMTRKIDGTLQQTSVITEACSTCTNGQRQVLSVPILDGDDKTWTLLADPIELVAGWAEAVSEVHSQPVSLMFRYTRGFQYLLSTGFVLSDAAGLVIAAEQAQFVTALKQADLPGFAVTFGEPVCTASGGCAKDIFTELVFSGDSKVTVGLSVDGEFSIGSQRYMARNSGAGYLVVGTCKDLERASPWSIWRKVGL